MSINIIGNKLIGKSLANKNRVGPMVLYTLTWLLPRYIHNNENKKHAVKVSPKYLQ